MNVIKCLNNISLKKRRVLLWLTGFEGCSPWGAYSITLRPEVRRKYHGAKRWQKKIVDLVVVRKQRVGEPKQCSWSSYLSKPPLLHIALLGTGTFGDHSCVEHNQVLVKKLDDKHLGKSGRDKTGIRLEWAGAKRRVRTSCRRWE